MAFFLHQWLLFFLFPLCDAATFSKPHAHPLYIGVVEINHIAKDATLEISCKLFAEDMADALEKNYKTPVDLSAPAQQKKINGLLADYVPKHLSIKTDGRAHVLRFVGFELEAESVYCYFEAADVPAVHQVAITNRLLYDFSESQINIMHVVVGGVRKSTKLNYPATDVQMQF